MTLAFDAWLDMAPQLRHHAFLLLHRAFARYTLSAERLADVAKVFCGISLPSHPSQLADALTQHPDIYIVDTERTFITRELVEPIRQRAMFPAVVAKRRLFVIEKCQRLNASAANILLKTVEEPGVSHLFLFTASQQQEVLPTIASRCQKIAIALPELKEPTPKELWEEEDFLWLRDFLAACLSEGLHHPPPFEQSMWDKRLRFFEGIEERILRDIVNFAQKVDKKYEPEQTIDVLAFLISEQWQKNSKLYPVCWYVISELRRWRKMLAFHVSTQHYLCRILLGVWQRRGQ